MIYPSTFWNQWFWVYGRPCFIQGIIEFIKKTFSGQWFIRGFIDFIKNPLPLKRQIPANPLCFAFLVKHVLLTARTGAAAEGPRTLRKLLKIMMFRSTSWNQWIWAYGRRWFIKGIIEFVWKTFPRQWFVKGFIDFTKKTMPRQWFVKEVIHFITKTLPGQRFWKEILDLIKETLIWTEAPNSKNNAEKTCFCWRSLVRGWYPLRIPLFH